MQMLVDHVSASGALRVSRKVFVFVLAAYLLQRVNLRQEAFAQSRAPTREDELLYDRDGFVQLLAIEVDAELVLKGAFWQERELLALGPSPYLSVLPQPESAGAPWISMAEPHALENRICGYGFERSSAPNSWRDNRTLSPPGRNYCRLQNQGDQIRIR